MLAPDYPREEHGWILFPRDTKHRHSILTPDLREKMKLHPAKMNMFLTEEIIRYVSKPGDTILEPFGGVGTTMVAALEGRDIIILELEAIYHSIIKDTYEHWKATYPVSYVTILQGDNRQLLPLPCDHVITSPPYAQTLVANARGSTGTSELTAAHREALEAYRGSGLNIGNLNPFIYSKQMDKVYDLLIQGIRPGGTMSIVIKDQMQAGKRILHSLPCMRSITRLGMEMFDWQKWKTPGTAFAALQKSKGNAVVEDEDIIFFRKPI